ncbi:hypothetical protein BDV98DRAFT_304611 [Pterulicium gracile]|uniref:Uncharacterized protein n=1 Tax=Pterulicium gracile TaxID=1884261 RepID=A0A5C3QDV9_9AGAR|nr:hypothetical protein BDV98DRAFT_304611 [Pterula gracilis]
MLSSAGPSSKENKRYLATQKRKSAASRQLTEYIALIQKRRRGHMYLCLLLWALVIAVFCALG